MSKPESSLWRYIKQGMAGRWDAQRHEDSTGLGIPDVSFGMNGVQGWIELKVIEKWPVRPTTTVRIPHYKDYQRQWCQRRGKFGGRTFLLIRVERTFILYHWSKVEIVGLVNQVQLRSNALKVWENRVDFAEMERLLTENP